MNEGIMLRQMVIGPVGTNVYFVKNTETDEMFIVDPADNAPGICEMVRRMEGVPKAVLLTHGHFDHITAAEEVRDAFHIPVLAYREEAEMLRDPELNMSSDYGPGVSFEADRYLEDKELFECAGFRVQVFHTPGHTKGSCCFYIEDQKILFSGDTLFCGSVGRTDFAGGSMSEMIKSLRFLTSHLPENTVVYPGHESATTIGDELRYNPFV